MPGARSPGCGTWPASKLAANDYSIESRLNVGRRRPSRCPAAGSNAIETANAIEAAMKELKKDFPEDWITRIAYDILGLHAGSPSGRELKTLIIAIRSRGVSSSSCSSRTGDPH